MNTTTVEKPWMTWAKAKNEITSLYHDYEDPRTDHIYDMVASSGEWFYVVGWLDKEEGIRIAKVSRWEPSNQYDYTIFNEADEDGIVQQLEEWFAEYTLGNKADE